MPRKLLLVLISLLTLPLLAQNTITKTDLIGTYTIKVPKDDNLFVNLEENKMTLTDEEEPEAEDLMDGGWSFENSILLASYIRESNPVEAEINFANMTMDKLKRGTFVNSTIRTFDDEKEIKIWIRKTN